MQCFTSVRACVLCKWCWRNKEKSFLLWDNILNNNGKTSCHFRVLCLPHDAGRSKLDISNHFNRKDLKKYKSKYTDNCMCRYLDCQMKLQIFWKFYMWACMCRLPCIISNFSKDWYWAVGRKFIVHNTLSKEIKQHAQYTCTICKKNKKLLERNLIASEAQRLW